LSPAAAPDVGLALENMPMQINAAKLIRKKTIHIDFIIQFLSAVRLLKHMKVSSQAAESPPEPAPRS